MLLSSLFLLVGSATNTAGYIRHVLFYAIMLDLRIHDATAVQIQPRGGEALASATDIAIVDTANRMHL